MAHKEIKTSITIQASPAIVWSVLSDLQSYSKWNPFITEASGELKTGSTLVINAGGMKFKPTVLAHIPQKELRWLGSLLFKGLFDGEHKFYVDDNGDGSVTFRQEEEFNGILVGLFAKKLDIDTRAGFEQMNEALKKLAEGKGAVSVE